MRESVLRATTVVLMSGAVALTGSGPASAWPRPSPSRRRCITGAPGSFGTPSGASTSTGSPVTTTGTAIATATGTTATGTPTTTGTRTTTTATAVVRGRSGRVDRRRCESNGGLTHRSQCGAMRGRRSQRRRNVLIINQFTQIGGEEDDWKSQWAARSLGHRTAAALLTLPKAY